MSNQPHKPTKYIGITQSKALDGQPVKVVRPDETMTITLNATVTAGEQTLTWTNEKLTQRTLNGNEKAYSTEKTMIIDNIEYAFKFYIYYATSNEWKIGCAFPQGLYNNADLWQNLVWTNALTESKEYSSTKYTQANSTGTAVLIKANVTI